MADQHLIAVSDADLDDPLARLCANRWQLPDPLTRGGDFAAHAEPGLLARDITEFYRTPAMMWIRR